jgi:hypothetical protein
MGKSGKRAELKSEKKSGNTAKTEVKAKVSKKAVDFKKPVATIPSAKHSAPISSKEILARVSSRTHLISSRTYMLNRHRKKLLKRGRRKMNPVESHPNLLQRMISLRTNCR